MAVVVLRDLAVLFQDPRCHDASLHMRASKIAEDIDQGIHKWGVVHHPVFGDVFAYEVFSFLRY